MNSVSEERVTDAGATAPVKGEAAIDAVQPLAAAALPDAGPLDGGEVIQVTRGSQLLQTIVSRIAAFVLGKPLSQVATGKFWTSDGAAINRQNDRVLVGAATVNSGNPNGVGTQDWMEQLRAYSTSISQHTVISTIGQIAIAAGSRTSDSPTAGSMGCIGYEAIVNNNNATQVQYAWGSYLEARRQPNAGTTTGLEIDTVNLGTEVDLLPYGLQPTGITPALWLASGAEVSSNPSTAAMVVLNNGATFKHGIVMRSGALKGDGSGPASAIALARNHQIEWYDSGNGLTGFIRSDAATHAQPCGILFSDGTIRFTNAGGYPIGAVINTPSSVNFPQMGSSATGQAVVFSANGSDANVDVMIAPKGAGVLSLSYGASTAAAPGSFNATRRIAVKVGTEVLYISASATPW